MVSKTAAATHATVVAARATRVHAPRTGATVVVTRPVVRSTTFISKSHRQTKNVDWDETHTCRPSRRRQSARAARRPRRRRRRRRSRTHHTRAGRGNDPQHRRAHTSATHRPRRVESINLTLHFVRLSELCHSSFVSRTDRMTSVVGVFCLLFARTIAHEACQADVDVAADADVDGSDASLPIVDVSEPDSVAAARIGAACRSCVCSVCARACERCVWPVGRDASVCVCARVCVRVTQARR